MEVMAAEVDGLEFGVGDLDAGGIAVWIELAANLEAGIGCGGGDQFDDDLMAGGLRRQFPVMNENRRCSILFHCVLQKHERKGVMT